MGTKVSFRGIKELADKAVQVIKSTEKDPQTLKEVGETAVRYVQGSVRAGHEEYKMAPVKPSTAAKREAMKGMNPPDPAYKKNKSMTFTGEFIESLTFEVRQGDVVMFFKGEHKPYKNQAGEETGKSVTNDQIHKWLKEGGRDVLFLSKKIKPMLEKVIERSIRRRIQVFKSLSRRLK